MRRLPLIWRVPLAVLILMIAVSAIITERVLDRLGKMQQSYLQGVADSYLDGVTASISPSVLRQDNWEIFDALGRLHPTNSNVLPSETVVTNPNGVVLAATDPLRRPTLETLADDFVDRFNGSTIQMNADDGMAYLVRDISYQDHKIGKVYTVLDAAPLLRERREVLATLVLTNGALTAILALIGFATVRWMIRPLQVLEHHMLEAADGTPKRITTTSGSSNSETWRLFSAFNSLLDADDERRELSRKLAEEEKLASLGRLSSVMAHEINNPLGGLLNAVDTLRQHGSKSDVRNASLDLLQRGLQGIGEVVRAALATYRPDKLSRPLAKRDFDDIRLLLTPELNRRNQTLDIVVDIADDTRFELPAGPVRQALINLLLNASAASPDGGTVGLAAICRESALILEVSDQGPGFPTEAVAILTGSGRAGAPFGAGLGLWVVHRIANDIGALVEAETVDGSGSVVRLVLGRTAGGALNDAA